MSEKELTKKRGSFKGHLTVFSNYLLALAELLKYSDARELQWRIGKIELLYKNMIKYIIFFLKFSGRHA